MPKSLFASASESTQTFFASWTSFSPKYTPCFMVALFNSFASGPSPVSIREKFPLPVVVSPLNESETFTPSIPSTARIASTSSAVIHSSSVCASSLTLMAICPPPISSISLFIWFLVPSPTDTMAITEAMPMIMPSIVRKERPLFAIMLWTAILIYSYRLLIGILSVQELPVLPFPLCNHPDLRLLLLLL